MLNCKSLIHLMKRFLTIFFFLVFALSIFVKASVSLTADNAGVSFPSEQDCKSNLDAPKPNDQQALPIESGFHSNHPPLTIGDGGRMNLIAGQSIVLKPGTRVLAGGYLRATIHSGSADQNQRAKQDRKSKKYSREEQAIEPVKLVATTIGISPFAKKSSRAIASGEHNNDGYFAMIPDVSGISPEQNRKTLGYITSTLNFIQYKVVNSYPNNHNVNPEMRETIAVLRL